MAASSTESLESVSVAEPVEAVLFEVRVVVLFCATAEFDLKFAAAEVGFFVFPAVVGNFSGDAKIRFVFDESAGIFFGTAEDACFSAALEVGFFFGDTEVDFFIGAFEACFFLDACAVSFSFGTLDAGFSLGGPEADSSSGTLEIGSFTGALVAGFLFGEIEVGFFFGELDFSFVGSALTPCSFSGTLAVGSSSSALEVCFSSCVCDCSLDLGLGSLGPAAASAPAFLRVRGGIFDGRSKVPNETNRGL